MTSPFQQIAPQYAALWSDTPRGRAQREQVWREIDGLFHPGDRVLDLGCGTGDDAVHLMSNDVKVLGVDSAPGMVEIARTRGVDARLLAIEDLAVLDGEFDGAISNFGALNCVANLDALSEALARLVASARKTRLVRNEPISVGRLATSSCSAGRATPSGAASTSTIAARASIARAFAPHFEFQRRVPIGRGDHQLLMFRRRRSC